MSFSVTALNLVNRVHRRRRMPDVGSFSETEDLATLDAVNNAIEETLSSKRWEFDMRRGQIALRGRYTGGTVSITADDSTASYANTNGVDSADVFGDYVVRLLPTGSSAYANTAFRVLTAVGSGTTGTLILGTDVPETMSSVDADLFYAEYMLPETVRNVLRISHQEESLNLEQVDPIVEFDELYPRPSIEFGTPELISVGGLDVSTYETGGTAPDPRLRMIVWPVPDSDYVLDYSYHYRHPALEAIDDTLDGVPPNVVDQIVDLAAADMKAYYEKDYDAIRLRMVTREKLDRMHAEHGGMYADRKSVGNWDGRSGRLRAGTSVTRGRLIGV